MRLPLLHFLLFHVICHILTPICSPIISHPSKTVCSCPLSLDALEHFILIASLQERDFLVQHHVWCVLNILSILCRTGMLRGTPSFFHLFLLLFLFSFLFLLFVSLRISLCVDVCVTAYVRGWWSFTLWNGDSIFSSPMHLFFPIFSSCPCRSSLFPFNHFSITSLSSSLLVYLSPSPPFPIPLLPFHP